MARLAASGGPVIPRDTAEPLTYYVSNTLVEPDPERSEEVSSLLAEWDFDGSRG